MSKEDEKIKIPFGHYFWIFLIVSVIGTYYEEGLYIVRHLFKYGTFAYSRRSGLFWGPINPVYGIGACMNLFLLGRKKKSKINIFIWSSIIGGVAEYILSFIQEHLVGTTSWDYSSKFLNIQGRTTITFMIAWGLFGLISITWLYPKISHLLMKIKSHIYCILTSILFIFIFFDMFITYTAFVRLEMMEKGIPPYTIVGEFYDNHFNKDYIKKKYPNMKEKKK